PTSPSPTANSSPPMTSITTTSAATHSPATGRCVAGADHTADVHGWREGGNNGYHHPRGHRCTDRGGLRLARPVRRADPAAAALAADATAGRSDLAGRRYRDARAARRTALARPARPARL